jgi:hypothetical protein
MEEKIKDICYSLRYENDLYQSYTKEVFFADLLEVPQGKTGFHSRIF